jgi:hypothetical protein
MEKIKLDRRDKFTTSGDIVISQFKIDLKSITFDDSVYSVKSEDGRDIPFLRSKEYITVMEDIETIIIVINNCPLCMGRGEYHTGGSFGGYDIVVRCYCT